MGYTAVSVSKTSSAYKGKCVSLGPSEKLLWCRGKATGLVNQGS